MRRLAFVIVLGLTACAQDGPPELLNLRQGAGEGPDEFAVLPTKPLTIPADLTALPPPTPGGTNLVDPTPFRDVAAALGGNPAAKDRPSRDGALVSYASRYGTDPAIRSRLSQEDLAFRRANDGRLLERLFSVNVYNRAYGVQVLDQYAELERLRLLGVRTPSAPPDPALDR